MELTRRSQLTGKVHTRDLPVDKLTVLAYMNGAGHIQDLFPDLSPAEREFIRTGITPEEWKEHFGDGIE